MKCRLMDGSNSESMRNKVFTSNTGSEDTTSTESQCIF